LKLKNKIQKQKTKSFEDEIQKISESMWTYKGENSKLVLSNKNLVKENSDLKLQTSKMKSHLQILTEQAETCKTENYNLVAKTVKENDNLMLELKEIQQKYKLLQKTFKIQQEEIFVQSSQKEGSTSAQSGLLRDLSELQYVYEKEHQEVRNHRQSYIDLKKKFMDQKQQLDDKSSRLSKLESFVDETKQLSHIMEEKLRVLNEDNATLIATVENNDKLYINIKKTIRRKGGVIRKQSI